jgi:predicted DCC family thiol-disulfide oxidoreductase YuxK
MDNSAVLIFDGDCGFCTSSANFFTAKTTRSLKAEAWQLIDVTRFGLTPEQTAKRVYLSLDGKTYSANKAIAKVLTLQTKPLYRFLGHLISIPPISWLAIPGYYLAARYRHLLPGGTPACKL